MKDMTRNRSNQMRHVRSALITIESSLRFFRLVWISWVSAQRSEVVILLNWGCLGVSIQPKLFFRKSDSFNFCLHVYIFVSRTQATEMNYQAEVGNSCKAFGSQMSSPFCLHNYDWLYGVTAIRVTLAIHSRVINNNTIPADGIIL